TLRTFLTPQLPEPPGARVLGCILQLAESEENARFWWQYAAGAGDPAASYCLYLHHRALGEHAPARWWHEQTELLRNTPSTDRPVTRGEAPGVEPDVVPDAVSDALDEVSTTDASLLPTALRILGALRAGPAAVPATVGAVIDYAPAAVGYVDDFDLPLTDPDFTDHIRTLIATDTTPARIRNRLQPRPKLSCSVIAERPAAPDLGMGMTRRRARSRAAAPEHGRHPPLRADPPEAPVKPCPFPMRNLALRHPFEVRRVVRSAESLTEFWILGCPGRVTRTWHRGGRAAVAAGERDR
ncbi:hypothetical protein JHN51_33440, partial [Streptomyces sp. MBT61]|nr:hypothetical protein [Streptomyces sp. MBT61]